MSAILLALLAAPCAARSLGPVAEQLAALESSGNHGAFYEGRPGRAEILVKGSDRSKAMRASRGGQAPTKPLFSGSIGNELQLHLTGRGCDGFFACLGAGLGGALTAPFLFPQVVGSVWGDRGYMGAGLPGLIAAGIAGWVAGLALGLAVAPLCLIGGAVMAVASLISEEKKSAAGAEE